MGAAEVTVRRAGRDGRAGHGPPGGAGEALERRTALLTLSTVVVSGANYLFALVMIRLLTAVDYVRYVSVQGLLLVLGTGCMAAVPWAVAHHVAVTPGRRAHGEALRFGLVASTMQGVAFALVAGCAVVPVSGWPLGLWTAAAAVTLSVIAAPLGLLQGRERLPAIAGLRLLETAVRIGASLVLLRLLSPSAVSPVAGFVAGSVALFGAALWTCRDAFPLRRACAADVCALLTRSATLGVTQAVLASLGVVDTVVVAAAGLGPAAGAYQIAALLGRVPMFLSTAVATGYYPAAAAAVTDAHAREHVLRGLRLFLRLGVPAAVLVASLPRPVIDLLAPGRAGPVAALLPATSTIGLLIGVITVTSTWQQARGRFGRVLRTLGPPAVLQPVLLVAAGRQWSAAGYALAGVTVVASVAPGVIRGLGTSGWRQVMSRRHVVVVLVGALLAAGSHRWPQLWPASVAVLCLVLR